MENSLELEAKIYQGNRIYRFTDSQLQQLLAGAAEIGAKRALTEAGLLKPYLKKSEAYKIFGRSNVDRWIREGLVTPRKDGNDSAAWRLERAELESVAKASNRLTYLTVEERQAAK